MQEQNSDQIIQPKPKVEDQTGTDTKTQIQPASDQGAGDAQ